MTGPRILFMGTPDFAVPSLELLITRGYRLIGVVTQPDRPKGRGRSFTPPPVKVIAEKNGLQVLQPERVRDEEFLAGFRKLSPDMVALVAFGQILPREIIESPALGCLNVHPSLLPKYRGAAPMNWTLIRGETRTGVTIMRMDEGVDSGDILLQEDVGIEPEETFGSLHDRLAVKGADMLAAAIDMSVGGTIIRTPQDHAAATYAPRLKKEDTMVNWDTNAHDIVNLIRGLSPFPCASTILDGKQLKIFAASVDESHVGGAGAGTIGRIGERGLPVAAKNGWVCLTDIQMESKKRMNIRDFLRGYNIKTGKMG